MSHKRIALFTCLILSFTLFACSKHLPDTYLESTATPTWYDPASYDTLTIATWNVEHFVDGYDNPYIDNDRENSPSADMEERRVLIAEAIRSLDADVLVLQELESDSYLQALADEYFPEMGYRVFAALESPDWYMNVVMMSRIPMGLFYSYAHINTPIPGQTDDEGNPSSQTFLNNRMWTADLLVSPDYRFTLTGLHLKAGRGPRNEAWRLGQIRLLRDHLEMLMSDHPNRNMVVMGDLNTVPGTEEFNALLGEKRPVFVDPLAGTDVYSHPSDSLFWRIDHILPNKKMNKELVSSGVEVTEPLPREKMIQISDHLPLMARFVTRDR